MTSIFTPPSCHVSRSCAARAALYLAQQALARGVIDRAPIVGVDEGEIPGLGALVGVRHARYGELQRRLREAVDAARERDALRERQEIVEEGISRSASQRPVDEPRKRRLVSLR